MLIEIKNWQTNDVIFSYDCEDNTIKKTVEEAVKRGVNLSYANLNGAKLSYADLSHTDLRNTNLREANLRCADIRFTNLSNANLSRANIRNANLREADLSNTKIDYPMNIPEGEFIAWKKICGRLGDYVIVKLKILADSKRSRATSDKCRCDKALVLGLETLKGEPLNIKEMTNYNIYKKCTYKVGEVVYPDKWDDNRWNECSHGIHFFLDRQRAVKYIL